MDLCVVCGDWPADERDHCPPKLLFPKPRPDDLITAPICSDCHEGTSRNDTYFRLKIAAMEPAGNHPAISEGDVMSRAIRGLNRPEAEGLRKSYIDDIHDRVIDGIRKPAYEVDIERIFSVVRRTVRGLYWHELDDVADPRRKVHVAVEREAGHTTETWKELRPLVEKLEQEKGEVLGDNVFSYWYGRATPGGYGPSTAWLLTYYGGVRFAAIV